jgi:hypothetical protein
MVTVTHSTSARAPSQCGRRRPGAAPGRWQADWKHRRRGLPARAHAGLRRPHGGAAHHQRLGGGAVSRATSVARAAAGGGARAGGGRSGGIQGRHPGTSRCRRNISGLEALHRRRRRIATRQSDRSSVEKWTIGRRFRLSRVVGDGHGWHSQAGLRAPDRLTLALGLGRRVGYRARSRDGLGLSRIEPSIEGREVRRQRAQQADEPNVLVVLDQELDPRA